MKKYLTYIKENKSQITIPDVAWLYFLHYEYRGKMEISGWKNDQRMGTNFLESLKKFDCVLIQSEYIYSSEDCVKIIDKYFGSKTFEKSVLMTDNLKKYENSDKFYGYPLSKIPYELYLHKNPNVEKNFDRIRDRIRNHFNSQVSSDHIIKIMSKSKDLKKWNFKKLYDMFGYIPENITIYRGIKSEYDPESRNLYSCWTTSKKEGERFAKYVFTGKQQFKPIYSKTQILLEAEVNINEILVVIGDDESEIIMKNPVKIKKITNLKDEKL